MFQQTNIFETKNSDLNKGKKCNWNQVLEERTLMKNAENVLILISWCIISL